MRARAFRTCFGKIIGSTPIFYTIFRKERTTNENRIYILFSMFYHLKKKSSLTYWKKITRKVNYNIRYYNKTKTITEHESGG